MELSWPTQLAIHSLLILNSKVSPGSRRKRLIMTSKLADLPIPRSLRPSKVPSKMDSPFWLRTFMTLSMLSFSPYTLVLSSRRDVTSISRWEIKNYLFIPTSTCICTPSYQTLITSLKFKLSAHWLTSLSLSLVSRTNYLIWSSERKDLILPSKRLTSSNRWTTSRLP